MGTGLGVLLLILILWCRHSPAAADFYATRLYPPISACLSWLASPFPISLTEWIVVLAIVLFIWLIVRAVLRRDRWWKCLLQEAVLLLWVYVWFYGAWGINYFRSDIYARTGTIPMPYEEHEFQDFLDEFAEQLNENWCPAEAFEDIDDAVLEPRVKAWYAALPSELGLCQPRTWQHPKRITFNRLFSGVGVLGFLGPAFDEMHLNREITPLERPFVFAHEYSHVLGVSSEAEANFWAFEASFAADSQAIRYSALFSLLTFTWNNIRSLLGEDAFQEWVATLRPEIREDMQAIHAYWQDRRWPWLARVQHRFYNFFLRSNRIADGTKNYGQVLRLVLTFSSLHAHEDGSEG
ncbi:MAG: DUF3810 domain-containing protein [Bacteroidales bacterium]|nr:DUF3810 domain-containing protein [Bacteroidales bacterium]